MAEVLITLVIIGIIAAITVPSIVAKTQDRQWTAGMQKVRSSIGEAFRLMSINEVATPGEDTGTFIDQTMSKYLKIMKHCGIGEQGAKDCGFPSKLTSVDGRTIETKNILTMNTMTAPYGITSLDYGEPNESGTSYRPNSTTNPTTQKYNDAHFFNTLDGISVMFFYNPYCAYDQADKNYANNPSYPNPNILPQFSLDVACFWGVYDMNGPKKPNRVGKDIGIVGSFFKGPQAIASTALPYPSPEKSMKEELGAKQGEDNWSKGAAYCASIGNGNYRLPDVNELSLMFLNRELVTNIKDKWFWSGSPLPGSASMRSVYFINGYRYWYGRTNSTEYGFIRCVRKDVGR